MLPHHTIQLPPPRRRSREVLELQLRASRIVQYAVQRGKLTRPVVCGRCALKTDRIEAHHEDYNNPLDVKWLCKSCHQQVHGRLRPPRGQMKLW
jgi:transposase-like protein